MYRVLVVDDEQLVCDFLQMKIGGLNPRFQVPATASNGYEALQYLEKNHVDLVITDIMMPGMDGLMLCERIRKKYPDMYIVILSGYGEFEYAQQAMRYDVHSYLLKPINNDELAATLSDLEQRKMKQNAYRQMIYATSKSYEQPDAEKERWENLSVTEKAKEYIWENYQKSLGLSDIAEHIGVSANYLSNIFRKEEGEPCMKYVTKVRMEVAGRYLLEHQILRIEEIASRTGFVSTKHFLHVFKKYYGMTPSEYKAEAQRKE